MSRTVLSSSDLRRVKLLKDESSERGRTSGRTCKRSSIMGALRRCGTKPLLLFFVLFTFCQLFLALLHTKLADDSIGYLMELPVMNDRRVYPIMSPKDLKNGQLEMQRDFNQVRDVDTQASLHSKKGTGDEQGNADVVVPSDKKMNPLAGLSNQIGHVRTKIQNTRQDELNSENLSKVKYILPVLLGNQGPNNQIQALKLVSIIAQRRNLTLVLAPFFDHGANLEAQRPHTFEETLDPDILAQFVSVATMEEFERQCERKADVVFLGTNMVVHQSLSQTFQINSFVGNTIKTYYNWTGIKIPSTFLYLNRSEDVIQIHDDLPYYVPVDDFLDKYPDSLTTSHQCNAFLYPYGYLGRLSYSQHISRYTKYFVRGKVVQETAQTFINTAMKNLTYVCIHWRFNKEWKDSWCKQAHALDLCNALDTLTPSQLAASISHFMAESDIKAAYFASELGNQNDLIKGLRIGVPNIHTTQYLIDVSPKLSRDNNYLTSLVEQEICKESTFFLASHLSSWSDMVKQDRYDQRWKEVNELLFK